MRGTYSTGTVTVSLGSPVVIGAGTGWDPAKILEGDMFMVAGYVIPIASVDSGTQITLGRTWPGTGAAGQLYDIAYVRAADRAYPKVLELLDKASGLTNAVQTTVQDLTAEAKAQARSNLGATALGATLFTLADKGAGREALGLGTAAVKNTGTSGDAVPVLNAECQFSGPVGLRGATTRRVEADPAAGSYNEASMDFLAAGSGVHATNAPLGGFGRFGYRQTVGNNDGAFIYAAGWSLSALFVFSTSGNATAPGSWVNGSDIAFKPDLTPIEDPLEKIMAVRGGVYHDARDGVLRASIVANDIDAAIPGVVPHMGPVTLRDGTELADALGLSYEAPMALVYAAVQALIAKVAALEDDLAALKPAQSPTQS